MPKNRLATRIDLDYNKNLKYPDVNEFLKESMYASNLTNFPDNPENAFTFFLAIANTITTVGTTLTIGTNLSLKPYLAEFKLYGYMATLEAVDHMKLEIDFLNEGVDANTKEFNISKTGAGLNLDIAQNSEIRGLQLPSIVNFSVKFPVSELVKVYNYVFNTKWKEAYAYYLNDPQTDAVLDGNAEHYSRLLWLFVRSNLYTLDIPAKLSVYYVDADEPGAVLNTTITLDGMLPQYRSAIDLATSTVDYNTGLGTTFDAFTFSYRPGALGKIRIKGFFTGGPKNFSEDSPKVVANWQATAYNSSIMAQRYAAAQHATYDIGYPEATFTYDYFINDSATPIIDDYLFDKFKAVPRYGVVRGLIIENYQFGHEAIKDISKNPPNPFKFSLTFISNSATLTATIHRYKFQLRFKSALDAPPDRDPVLFSTNREMALMHGDFLNDTRKARTVTTSKELYGGTTRINKASATQAGSSGFLVYSQRTSNKNDADLSAAGLVNCSVNLISLGEAYTEETENNPARLIGHRYKLEIVWPTTLNEQALYLIAKCSYIELAISDYFQSIMHSGQIEKASYDTYYTDGTNPLYTPSVVHYPKFQIKGFGGLRQISDKERSALEQVGAGTLFAWSSAPNAEVQVAKINFSDGKKSRYFSYTLLNYLKGTNKSATCTSPYFMDKGWVVLSHKLPSKDHVYLKNISSVKKLSDAYSSYTYNAGTDTVSIEFQEAKLQLVAKSIMGKSARQPLPAGTYYMWVITGITAINFADNFNLCKLSYASGTKFHTNVLMMYEFEIK